MNRGVGHRRIVVAVDVKINPGNAGGLPGHYIQLSIPNHCGAGGLQAKGVENVQHGIRRRLARQVLFAGDAAFKQVGQAVATQ